MARLHAQVLGDNIRKAFSETLIDYAADPAAYDDICPTWVTNPVKVAAAALRSPSGKETASFQANMRILRVCQEGREGGRRTYVPHTPPIHTPPHTHAHGPHTPRPHLTSPPFTHTNPLTPTHVSLLTNPNAQHCPHPSTCTPCPPPLPAFP